MSGKKENPTPKKEKKKKLIFGFPLSCTKNRWFSYNQSQARTRWPLLLHHHPLCSFRLHTPTLFHLLSLIFHASLSPPPPTSLLSPLLSLFLILLSHTLQFPGASTVVPSVSRQVLERRKRS